MFLHNMRKDGFIYDMCAKIANYCRLASFYNKKFEKKIKIIAIS